jgi:DNA-binding NtrC family response regulator
MREITPAAMDMLAAHDWPGNVRELENVVQSAIILAKDDTIQPEDLPRNLQQAVPRAASQPEEPLSFEDQLWEYKLELANRALAKCNGNKTLAARSLQISRAYFHRLIRPSGNESAA